MTPAMTGTWTRAAQLRALAAPLVRAVHWQPVPVAAAMASALLWWQDDRMADPTRAVWMLRAVALLLAVGVAFALDDRTRSLLGAVPTPLWWRAAVRLLVVGAPAALVWLISLSWVGARSAGALPAAALSLEALTLAAVVTALAGGLARWRAVPDPGTVAAPVLLAVGLLLPQLPEHVGLAVLPGPGWDAAHVRWSVLLAAAAVVLAVSLRDPAARWRS